MLYTLLSLSSSPKAFRLLSFFEFSYNAPIIYTNLNQAMAMLPIGHFSFFHSKQEKQSNEIHFADLLLILNLNKIRSSCYRCLP